jgi:hypothetical protein
MTRSRPLVQTSSNLVRDEVVRPRLLVRPYKDETRTRHQEANPDTPTSSMILEGPMTTTLDAPTPPPAPVTCTRCGRPLRSPISRLVRLGSHCRDGLTERQLVDALTGAAA